MKLLSYLGFIIAGLLLGANINAQTVIRGEVIDGTLAEPLIGANVIVKGTLNGTSTDFDGKYVIETESPLPIILEISYTGFETIEVEVVSANEIVKTFMSEGSLILDAVEVKGSRILEKQKESPLTVEALDLIAIKETPASNFYDGLGALKDVDLTKASLGFTVINTRGFNSTSPVRSLQIIDGVDNQAPGLNFSLGNFLGASELDVVKVEIVVGASSAYYGPNAFNGVVSMETKSPFFHKGLSAMVKGGERNLFEGAFRYADAINNKNGQPVFAYKINGFALFADDWEAQNYSPIDGSRVDALNPGGFDAVNIYGDEYYNLNDVTGSSSSFWTDPGLGVFYREGYREVDLVDYGTKNYKANATFHLRTKPSQEIESPELILSSSFGSGTTVYQGDNRFSLRNILFFQNRLEYRKRNKFFIRAYATHEDAGDSYDPYFTALRLQEQGKGNEDWALLYRKYWKDDARFPQRMRALGYPSLVFDPETVMFTFDFDGANQWLANNRDSLAVWHQLATNFANNENIELDPDVNAFLRPGTAAFQEAFDKITTTPNNQEGGTMFIDKSALYHLHGEYMFTPLWMDEIRVGANYRLYKPRSEGTIFYDTAGVVITNSEFGIYGGMQKKFMKNKMTASATLRIDKNVNLPWIQTPAASLVYNPKPNTYARISFSSALRNPTLSDQYLNLNVGPATLAGNINGVDSLLPIDNFLDYLSGRISSDELAYFDIDPIKPERVQTFEVGLRSTILKKVYADLGYYYNSYQDFLGFTIGIDSDINFNDPLSFPENTVVYRYAANAKTRVQTQGFSMGLNYYFANGWALNGNYSYNNLIKANEADPIIPAYNTPKHKYNLGLSGRDLTIDFLNLSGVGFNVNYKWVEGFIFEGSPQFTGFVPSYDLLDAQINYKFKKANTILKIGASNLLNNRHIETYGGPEIGRMTYVSLTYDFKKK